MPAYQAVKNLKSQRKPLGDIQKSYKNFIESYFSAPIQGGLLIKLEQSFKATFTGS